MNTGITTANSTEINALLSFREQLKTHLKKKVTVNLFGCRKEVHCEFNQAIEKAFRLTDQIILDKISDNMKPGEKFSFGGDDRSTWQKLQPEKEQAPAPKIDGKTIDEYITELKKKKAPSKPQLTLENYTPTKKQWRAKDLVTGLYFGKLKKLSGGCMSNLSDTGTICKRRPSPEQVVNSWYKYGIIINPSGGEEFRTPADIKIERVQ